MNPSIFEKEMSAIRADFHRITDEFVYLDKCVPFSPQAYNAISSIVLESIYTCIEEIATLFDSNNYYYNLGIILYKGLLSKACTHYFREYERIFGFVDPRLEQGHFVPRRPGFSDSFFHKVAVKTSGIVLPLARIAAKQGAPRIGWAGATAFSWTNFALEFLKRGIWFTSIQADEGIHIPILDRQINLLYQWANDLYPSMVEIFGTKPQHNNPFGREKIDLIVTRLLSFPAMSDNSVDLLITGSLGEMETRLYTLQAQERNIPVITVSHGAFHAYDEPWWPLYENKLPDAKIMYGLIDKQKIRDSVNTNLVGRSIRLYSRSDSYVQSIYKGGEINRVPSLHVLKAVHLSAGGGWQKERYGPYRDVHPATYLRWQEMLLAWLEEQTGRRPFVRLHPKRDLTRYDPEGYQNLDGDMSNVLDVADVFVIDFPTTSLAYIAATSKPVLFFDIGLRRLHPNALNAIRGRCHYASVDMMDPEEGFETMLLDLSRECHHTFVPIYCLSEEPHRSEISRVADIVAQSDFLEG